MRISHRFFLWENRKSVFYASLLLLFTDLLILLFPLCVKWVIDHMQGTPLPTWVPPSLSELPSFWLSLSFCLFLVAVSALSVIGRYYWRVHIIWSFFPHMHALRISLFRHLSRLASSYFRKHKSGDLLSTLSEDTEKIRMTLSFGSLCVIDSVINFLIFPWVLFWLSPELTLYILPFLVMSAAGLFFLSDRLSSIYKAVQDQIAVISGKAFEIVGGLRVIKAFAKEDYFKRDFRDASERLARTSSKLAYFESAFMPGLQLAIGLSMAFCLLYGGWMIFEGNFSVADLVAYQLYLGKLDWPVIALGWFIQMFRTSQASKARINELLSEPEVEAKGGRQYFNFLAPRVEAKNLSLRFDNLSVWEGLSFQIEKARWYGLTGPIGSGKTLLLQSIAGAVRNYSGKLSVFGNEVCELDEEALESEVLFVPQDVFLFSKSIKDNIGLGSSVSDEKVREILRALRFDLESLEARGGLWTRLGERGINVSGGQKQRIALARSLVRKRKIYLFDDVFSHVDADTEAQLLPYLRSVIDPDASVILVSQRLETLASFDQIFVLADKKMEFQGRFEDAKSSSAFIHRLEYLQRKFQGVA